MVTKYLLDLLFPRSCPVCQSPLSEGVFICQTCVEAFDRTEQALNRDNETEKMFAHMPHFAYGGCWLHYKKGALLQQLIHQAKYGKGNPPLLRQMGQQCAKEWSQTGFFDPVDLIVPIPLHKSRLKERGFNQSEYIALGLSDVLKIPMDTDHLTREKATRKQSRSSFEERQEGVRNAFQINHPEELYGQTIMLVDDIITTGATLRAAIDAMKDVYRCKIVVFGLARAI